MPTLQFGGNRSLPVYPATPAFDYASFVDLEPVSALAPQQRTDELRSLADALARGLPNFTESFEIAPGFYNGLPCVSAALWHPAFMCREWIEMLDSLLANASFPATWSVFCGVETLDTPADEYDIYADAPIISFSFLFNRQSGLVVDDIPTVDFLSRFGETGLVPLNLP